ncbi:hypothetical protein PORY_000140 [Pneumocystis oryctolagi]|uniref:Uncharacterized protein n=1 Tax=Pneumocystis oryctolagi TaxID=42067 RepID=A0ACB7CEE0_9ASCO|nr:hypothetical protein PORY_000140 [Pneumocystis oryctolagi]
MAFRRSLLWIFFFFCFTAAYFRIFDNFFQKNEKKNQEMFHADWLREKFQSISCSEHEYLCKDTLQCVNKPGDCPCPFPTSQKRCPLGNGNYVCVSMSEDYDPCERVELYRSGRYL